MLIDSTDASAFRWVISRCKTSSWPRDGWTVMGVVQHRLGE